MKLGIHRVRHSRNTLKEHLTNSNKRVGYAMNNELPSHQMPFNACTCDVLQASGSNQLKIPADVLTDACKQPFNALMWTTR